MPTATGATPDAAKGTSPPKRYQQQNQRRGAPVAKPPVFQRKFEGRCIDLKGHIYDCRGNVQVDQFTKTTWEITNYVGTKYKNGADTQQAIENEVLPTIVMPADPGSNASATEKRIWEKQVDGYVKRLEQLDDNIKMLYSLVWGQCTDAMQARVRALAGYATATMNKDGLALLAMIRKTAFNFQSQKKLHHAVHESKKNFFKM